MTTAYTAAILLLALLGVLAGAERLVRLMEKRGLLIDPDPPEWDA